jgi:hypothetical protein
MNDSIVSSSRDTSAGRRWLLLIHHLPPKPDYLRVKVRRRLHGIGAAPLKNSVYVLPHSDESLEDFQWLAAEIRAEGGEAIICDTAFVDGVSDEEIQAMFDAKSPSPAAGTPPLAHDRVEPGRTWVTRRGVHVDRMASAWLIRRFIDSKGHFKFVAARGYHAEQGELRFDMFDAEYTHVGDRCTFQVLLDRFGMADPALAAIGEVVRDIDCKDVKYGRAETAGVAAMINAIAESDVSDDERLARSAPLFDGLVTHFGGRPR